MTIELQELVQPFYRPRSNVRWIYNSGVNGVPLESHFTYEECSFPDDDLQSGDVLVQNLYLSVDPAQVGTAEAGLCVCVCVRVRACVCVCWQIYSSGLICRRVCQQKKKKKKKKKKNFTKVKTLKYFLNETKKKKTQLIL